jgi:tetratricopeptide (TPR) repeat protein
MSDEPQKELDVGNPQSEALDRVTAILRDGVALIRVGDHATAIRRFDEVYKSSDLPKPVSGLSYYALCLSRVRKQHREAIALCERAVSEKPDDPVHYANLAEVYLLANRRMKAVKTTYDALEKFPRTKIILDLKERVGERRRPVLPFLARSNPVNMVLGHMRHTWSIRGRKK